MGFECGKPPRPDGRARAADWPVAPNLLQGLAKTRTARWFNKGDDLIIARHLARGKKAAPRGAA